MTEDVTRRKFIGRTAAGAAALSPAAVATAQPSAAENKRAIIDAHVHLKHGDAAGTEYAPQVIVETMDAAGIDQSIVFAMKTTTRRSIEMAADAVAQFPDRLIPFAYGLPHFERSVLGELEAALAERHFRGIKLHAGEFKMAEYLVDPVLRLAGEYQVPCLIDCMGKADHARRMAKACPATVLILAHLGKYLGTDADLVDQFIRLAEKFPNVFLDISGVVLMEKIPEAVDRVGSAKLIWGTDGPKAQPDPATFAKSELAKIRKLPLNAADRQNILGGTIRKLIG